MHGLFGLTCHFVSHDIFYVLVYNNDGEADSHSRYAPKQIQHRFPNMHTGMYSIMDCEYRMDQSYIRASDDRPCLFVLIC